MNQLPDSRKCFTALTTRPLSCVLLNDYRMQFQSYPLKGPVHRSAESLSALQSAVAFWGVFIGFAIGCGRPTSNLVKYQIDSSSMAPTWFGPHLIASCRECGQRSAVVREAFDPALPTRCFSCGAVCESPKAQLGGIHAGEVIEISKSETSLTRFDVVTFKPSPGSSEHDEGAQRETLKRIWALPGEYLELHDGNAWIDGKPLQKSIGEFAAIGIPLSRFPKDSRSHWWVVDKANGETHIELAAGQGYLNLQRDQRLEFRYVRPNRNAQSPAMLRSPVVNDFPFNQNSIAQFHDVADVLLAIELYKPVATPWVVKFGTEGGLYRVHVGANEQVDGTAKVETATHMVFAICDGRLLVSTDLNDYQWELVDLVSEVDSEHVAPDSLLSITTTGDLGISRLLVARDQWLGPRMSREVDWVPTGNKHEIETAVAGGYFVLGDNLELSSDSRDAAVGRISPKRITGQVKRLGSEPHWIRELLDHTFRDVGVP
jgi:Signal peptidase, peptidase S26